MTGTKIGLLDPSLKSKNLGDSIIAESVRVELTEMFPNSTIYSFPTQKFWSKEDRRLSHSMDFFIFGGSNILAHNFPFNFQWNISPFDLNRIKRKLHLMGVGKWQDGELKPFAGALWKNTLKSGIHSVRDSNTYEMLNDLEVNAINTTCPTMWKLETNYKFSKKQKVIATLTDYKKNPERDLKIIEFLRNEYDEVVFWPQGSGDWDYIQSVFKEAAIVERSLGSFDSLLSTDEYDYFGTRLHAGIRALQHGVRAIIVPVDNRSRDMGKDTGLLVANSLKKSDLEQLVRTEELDLKIPITDVSAWKKEIINLYA